MSKGIGPPGADVAQDFVHGAEPGARGTGLLPLSRMAVIARDIEKLHELRDAISDVQAESHAEQH